MCDKQACRAILIADPIVSQARFDELTASICSKCPLATLRVRAEPWFTDLGFLIGRVERRRQAEEEARNAEREHRAAKIEALARS